MSQQLNSLLWEKIKFGETIENCSELYKDICKLAVLSNLEIDRAKREFVINSTTEINLLKEKYKLIDDNKTVKPIFFKMITTENGYDLSDNVHYRYFETSMDYLQKVISQFNFREGRERKRTTIPFMDIVKKPTGNIRQAYYYSKKNQIIETVKKAKEEKKRLFIDYDHMSQDEKNVVWTQVADITQNCIDEIDKMSSCPATMYLTLKELDNDDNRDVARFVFEVLFGKPNQAFFTMIKESREDIYTIEESESGDIQFYGYKFIKKHILQPQT